MAHRVASKRLHTANRSYCTHAVTHSKQELLHTRGYTQQTVVSAHMRLHTANGSYCTHVATHSKEELLRTCGYTQQQELLHTWGYTYQTGVIAHMRLHTARLRHFNFYCVNRASQVSKDRIT